MCCQKSSKARPAQATGEPCDGGLSSERTSGLCGDEAVAARMVLPTQGKGRRAIVEADRGDRGGASALWLLADLRVAAAGGLAGEP